MIELNKARWIWLSTRNKDLMSECAWRLERLVLMTNPDTKDHIYTEYFDVTFNSVHERIMLMKYLEGLGYKMETEGSKLEGQLECFTIRIGI